MWRTVLLRPSVPRILDGVAVLLLVVFVLSGARAVRPWLEARSARQTQDAMSSALPSVGQWVEALVVSDQDGSVRPLSDLGEGKCRYVILGSRVCPHTRTAANRWMLTALNDPAGASMPEGWDAFWVALDETTGRDDLFDAAFPSPTFFARDRLDLIVRAGVSYMPMHLVLDRQGVVVAAGPERRLLPISAFLDDCTIDPTIAPAAANEVTPVDAADL